MRNVLYNYLILNNRLAIPGVGVFTVEQVPARLDFVNKTLLAPLSVIRFSLENINAADRQFYQFLARTLRVDETTAIRRFNDFAFDLKNDLATTGHAELPGIGKLIKAFSNTYTFHAENMDEEFFPEISVERVIREKTSHTILVGEAEKTSDEMLEILSDRSASNRWWIYAIILGVLGIGLITYYYLTHSVNV